MLQNKLKHILLIIYCILFCQITKAQDIGATRLPEQVLTLDDVLNLARENSLDALIAKQEYGVSYWEFRAFKSSLLPQVDLTLEPLTYDRSLALRYDSEENVDEYRTQEYLNSYAYVSVSQNIRATGATLYVNSSLNRLENYDPVSQNFSATPFSIAISQPIMAFNTFKWKKKTAPLEYNKAKQDFIYDLESINLEIVEYYFNWALACKNFEMAKENKKSAEKMYAIGKKRYEIGAIERDELLNLELDVLNAKTNLTESQQDSQEALSQLNIFLRTDLSSNITPALPELISNLQIDITKAIELAYANNPDILDFKLRKVEALRDLDEAIKDNRFDLSLTASYGINQQADTFSSVYSNYLDQQAVAIQLSIPILDWGERKGNIKTAKMTKKVVDIELQQEEETFKQNITLKVNDFNLQKELVLGALRTSEISRESYLITEKRFLSGQIDLLNLSSSRNAWQLATESYIQSLQNYWSLYYEVQQLTLYNFMNDNTIKQDFDTILND